MQKQIEEDIESVSVSVSPTISPAKIHHSRQNSKSRSEDSCTKEIIGVGQKIENEKDLQRSLDAKLKLIDNSQNPADDEATNPVKEKEKAK